MPAPSKAMIEPIVTGLLAAEGVRGSDSAKLASAIAETIAQALALLLAQAMVMPGIACTPAASAAPGRLA